MIQIVFTNSTINEIEPFRKIPFSEVCEITHTFEQINRENEIESEMGFYLIDEDNNELYTGTISLGSGYADNIYDHIYKRLMEMELSKEQERQRSELLSLLESELPDLPNYEEEEEEVVVHHAKDDTAASPKKSGLTLLKVIGLVVGSIGVLSTILVFVFMVNNKTTETASNVNEPLIQALRYASIQQYDQAAEQFDKLKYNELEKQDKKAMLFSYLLSGQAQKAIDLEATFADSIISYYVAMDKLEELAKINSEEETIQFEKAYQRKEYKTVIEFSDKVALDGRREEMIVNSFIEIKDLEKALEFAESVGNKGLMDKVNILINEQTKAKEKEEAKTQEKTDKEQPEKEEKEPETKENVKTT
ncbi:hypothetical protein [Metabacillus fastidiosus]|uniref:hypothetical protein n=1 Tax=Metabacillus fastidiosus TaxID=1458 RepID=UPI003D2827ED